MDNTSFSKVIKELIDTRGISQKWLADEAETTEATISRYVAGKTQPEISIVVKIAKALSVSVDYLCGLTDIPIPKESLGSEFKTMMRCYERASTHEKKILWMVFENYLSGEEYNRLVNCENEL